MAKKDQLAIVKSSEAAIVEARSAYQAVLGKAAEEADRILTRFALALYRGNAAKVAAGSDQKDAKTWRELQGAGMGKRADDGTFGNLSPSSIYRYLNAGHVAAILGDAVGEAAYTALVPLYRVLKSAEPTSEGMAAAETTVRDTWASVCKTSRTTPSAAAVDAAVTALYPEPEASADGEGTPEPVKTGTRGPAKGSSKGKRNQPTDTTENDGNGNETTVVVDAAAVESAAKVIGSTLTALKRRKTTPTIPSVMLMTVRLCKEHGVLNVEAALATIDK